MRCIEAVHCNNSSSHDDNENYYYKSDHNAYYYHDHYETNNDNNNEKERQEKIRGLDSGRREAVQRMKNNLRERRVAVQAGRRVSGGKKRKR